LRGLAWSALDPLRARITGLAVVGGLTGMPQVSIPGAEIDGLPIGLSVIGRPGSDATLVAVAHALSARRA
jgi:amidase